MSVKGILYNVKITFVFEQIILIKIIQIRCKWDGHCTGSGKPDRNTLCGICYSCTYKGCCHWLYTFVNVCCQIPGWRHKDYQKRFCKGV
ncbi:unnamed protein product [Meloidogyne enterolobii]|uniref:Uncharacterized protein n=1 Tax=Meloidogyne enterolobii TaxID=390850 RepID=A0ACB0XKF7_MELEN